MSARTGQCLCGAVRFEAAELGGFGICHCKMCQRWGGGPMFGVTVPEAAMTVSGAGNIGSYRSSGWASRSFCTRCGSVLWYRYDKGRDGTGNYEVPIGLLDDADGLELRRELFIDVKPDRCDRRRPQRLTAAEVVAMYRAPSSVTARGYAAL